MVSGSLPLRANFTMSWMVLMYWVWDNRTSGVDADATDMSQVNASPAVAGGLGLPGSPLPPTGLPLEGAAPIVPVPQPAAVHNPRDTTTPTPTRASTASVASGKIRRRRRRSSGVGWARVMVASHPRGDDRQRLAGVFQYAIRPGRDAL